MSAARTAQGPRPPHHPHPNAANLALPVFCRRREAPARARAAQEIAQACADRSRAFRMELRSVTHCRRKAAETRRRHYIASGQPKARSIRLRREGVNELQVAAPGRERVEEVEVPFGSPRQDSQAHSGRCGICAHAVRPAVGIAPHPAGTRQAGCSQNSSPISIIICMHEADARERNRTAGRSSQGSDE